MKRLIPLAALLAACNLTPPCPTIVYAGGSSRSPTVAVAESLLVETPGQGPSWVCQRIMSQSSYDLVDQPDAEVALAEQIAGDPKVVVVVGHQRSRGSLAVAPVYARAGIPQIVPAATSRLLRSVGPWTFVLAPGDSAQAVFLAAAVDSMRLRRAILLYSGEPYGEGLVEAIRPELALRHIAVVDEVRLGVGTDVATLAEAAVRGHSADVVLLLVDYGQAGTIARTVVPLRPRLRLIAGDGAMYAEGLRRVGGSAAESLYVLSLWRPDTSELPTRRFIARFRALAGRDPTPSEALGEDAILYARTALAAVGPDRSAIRAWLAGPGGATPPPGHITGATLHDGPPPRFMLTRIGPPPTTAP
ncbi:MAG: ABC transporter substrate-binding protein [Gemmatimonadota bacterium]